MKFVPTCGNKKEAGADLIKIFASQSIRQGGGMTLSQEQLSAACDEAKKQGLRTLVQPTKMLSVLQPLRDAQRSSTAPLRRTTL